MAHHHGPATVTGVSPTIGPVNPWSQQSSAVGLFRPPSHRSGNPAAAAALPVGPSAPSHETADLTLPASASRAQRSPRPQSANSSTSSMPPAPAGSFSQGSLSPTIGSPGPATGKLNSTPPLPPSYRAATQSAPPSSAQVCPSGTSSSSLEQVLDMLRSEVLAERDVYACQQEANRGYEQALRRETQRRLDAQRAVEELEAREQQLRMQLADRERIYAAMSNNNKDTGLASSSIAAGPPSRSTHSGAGTSGVTWDCVSTVLESPMRRDPAAGVKHEN